MRPNLSEMYPKGKGPTMDPMFSKDPIHEPSSSVMGWSNGLTFESFENNLGSMGEVQVAATSPDVANKSAIIFKIY